MTENQKNLKIAFTDYNSWRGDGLEGYKEQVVWSGDGAYKKEENLRPNKPQQLKIKYRGYIRGRSALNIEWIDEENKTLYYSSMNLLDLALTERDIINGEIEDVFVFKKQGTSILLEFYRE